MSEGMTDLMDSRSESRFPTLCSWAISALGLALRVEHALTFNGPKRGADYAANVHGVYWMMAHWRPFDFTPQVSVQVGYQPPLWFALGALILRVTGHERPIAWLAVLGWVLRQFLLARMLRESIPHHRWSSFIALAINAVLPISILTDGKLNPEGLHTSIFMVAVYALWRLEREAQTVTGMSVRSAVLLGAASGFAVLTKATGGLLPMATAIVFVWQVYCLRGGFNSRAKLRALLRAGAASGLAWLVVAGWWCGPNLIKYHHPFPHIWNLSKHLSDPVLYRRPLGWIMPFEWREYLKFPVIYTTTEPRPNFWATSVVGSWTDIYNRGFCRLQGGPTTDHVFGANWGPGYGTEWHVTLRCIQLFVKLAWVGVVLSLESVIAVGYILWLQLRSKGRVGSLALPVSIGLVSFFVMLFALVYPFDDNVVLNPRYLLPAATPMSACLGIALAELPVSRRGKIVLQALTLIGIGAVMILVVLERWGH
jgi:Dolichyl-phosphate-mannose-protein mannosyltransferase